jgi:hypothetical protein
MLRKLNYWTGTEMPSQSETGFPCATVAKLEMPRFATAPITNEGIPSNSNLCFDALAFLGGCIEFVPLETLDPVGFTLGEVLVVDARITDEN